MIEIDNKRLARTELLVYSALVLGLGVPLLVIAIDIVRGVQLNVEAILFGAFFGLGEFTILIIAVRTVDALVWKLEIDEKGILVHRLRHSTAYKWSDVERISTSQEDIRVPVAIFPLSVSVGGYRMLTLKLTNGITISVKASVEVLERVDQFLAAHCVDYLAVYADALRSLPYSAVRAAYWAHFGDVPTSDVDKEACVETIVQKVAVERDSARE